jgi:hypothetical protein
VPEATSLKPPAGFEIMNSFRFQLARWVIANRAADAVAFVVVTIG